MNKDKDYFSDALDKQIEATLKLQEEIAELKDDNKVMADNYSKMEQKFYDNLTKAKNLLNDFLLIAKVEHLKDRYETVDEAEQFLEEDLDD